MKIHVLGAGVCASHFVETQKNIYPPAFLVSWGNDGQQLLFDCSPAVQQRLEAHGIDYASIHEIAISHMHPDHCAPVHFVQSVFCKGIWGGEKHKNDYIHFYGSDALVSGYPKLLHTYISELEGDQFAWPQVSITGMSNTDRVCLVFDASLTARSVYHGHGKCDAIAFRLETPEGIVAYSGDTGLCDGIYEIAKNADIFISECSARIGDVAACTEYGHLTPEAVADIAVKGNVKKLVLFHYTGLDTDEKIVQAIRDAQFMGDVVLAKDGEVLEY